MTTWLCKTLGVRCFFRTLLAGLVPHGLLLAGLASGEAADRESMLVRWQCEVKELQNLAMSADGQLYGGVDRNGVVSFYDLDGELVCKKQVSGATDVLIAKAGRSFLVYSRLNPLHLQVNFFRRNGRPVWQHEIDDTVWCGAVSPDGEYAAVATGDKYVYLYEPDPGKPRYRRWRLRGIGHCLAFTPDSKELIVATWQDSGIACYNLSGELDWIELQDSDRQYKLQISRDGRYILGVLPSTQHSRSAEVCLWNSQGKRLWRRKLEAFDVAAQISPDSQYVAVSYATILSRKGSEVVERKIALYDSGGKLLWRKGGLFFGPRLIGLSPTGSSVIVSNRQRTLYNIDKRGRIVPPQHRFGAMIQMAIPSADGRRILLYSRDNQLYLVEVG